MGPVLVTQCFFINARGYFWLPQWQNRVTDIEWIGTKDVKRCKSTRQSYTVKDFLILDDKSIPLENCWELTSSLRTRFTSSSSGYSSSKHTAWLEWMHIGNRPQFVICDLDWKIGMHKWTTLCWFKDRENRHSCIWAEMGNDSLFSNVQKEGGGDQK